MQILFTSPEVTPLAKVGGLADVVSALPKELARLGHDVRIVLPLYGHIRPQADWQALPDPLVVHVHPHQYCRVWQTVLPGTTIPLYLLEHHGHFGSESVYLTSYTSARANGERFTFLSRATLDLCYKLKWTPHVIHCHDWTTGLVPIYLNTTDIHGPLRKTGTVFTIHNLEHQGVFEPDLMYRTGLPMSTFTPDGLEAMGCVNMLKGGLYHATKLTTVSPNYAREIQTYELGCGLESVLRFRSGDLIGILNGIDTHEWDPSTDPHLPTQYTAQSLQGKATCKRAMQQLFNLEINPNLPLFAVISRLYHQKGLDMLVDIIDQLIQELPIQIMILGSGDERLEHAFNMFARRYPGLIGTFIGYDPALAHQMTAGADFFIMPSRFEPCGLTQLYAMAYGTLPIARATGGLADTVQHYNPITRTGTGFLFDDASPQALYGTLKWVTQLYYEVPWDIQQLRINAMTQDYSWQAPGAAYARTYEWAYTARAHL